MTRDVLRAPGLAQPVHLIKYGPLNWLTMKT
jgi:hypothetical protein